MIFDAAQYIKQNEGFRQYPYRCTRKALSIGYGFNLDSQGLSREEADCLLSMRVKKCEDYLTNLFGKDLWEAFGAPRRMALVDMVYNLGVSKFASFYNMIHALRQQDFSLAADEAQDSLWFVQVGNRGKRCVDILRGDI